MKELLLPTDIPRVHVGRCCAFAAKSVDKCDQPRVVAGMRARAVADPFAGAGACVFLSVAMAAMDQGVREPRLR